MRETMRDTKRVIGSIVMVGIAAFVTSHSLRADNWPQWRGPLLDGSSNEKNLPVRFSKTENVQWAADLPGPSAATPIIWGDRVFVSSVDPKAKTTLAICLDRATGKELWRRETGSGMSQDDRSNYASPSPLTDGRLAWFFYGNGELIAFDFDGKKAWARNMQKDYGQFAFLWTFSTSPLLFDGKLYLQVLQRDVPVNGRGYKDAPNESYLLALDPATGKELWRQVRPADAVAESREAFTTPIPFTHDGRSELLVAGGDCITSHDPRTGQELWRWGSWNPSKIGHWRLVPSPVAGGGVVLACAPKGSPVYAVKAGGKGTLKDSDLAWISQDREVSSDVSTPLFYKGRFYILNSDKRNLSCVEPANGKVVWTGSLESKAKIEASPTGADDKVYVMNQRGDVFVVQIGDEFKMLHTASLGDEGDKDLRSSIAVSQGSLFVRTGGKLYCIQAAR
jgi:outer membrane protein assembly factor BamB